MSTCNDQQSGDTCEDCRTCNTDQSAKLHVPAVTVVHTEVRPGGACCSKEAHNVSANQSYYAKRRQCRFRREGRPFLLRDFDSSTRINHSLRIEISNAADSVDDEDQKKRKWN